MFPLTASEDVKAATVRVVLLAGPTVLTSTEEAWAAYPAGTVTVAPLEIVTVSPASGMWPTM